MTEKEALQSKVIDFLRFPMAMMVIFIHQNPVFMESSAGVGGMIFNAIGSAGSHVLSHIAVPMFFLFSGYLYFFHVKSFGWEAYFKKTKKRFKSLILPYIYWNLIAFGIIVLKKIAGILIKGKPSEGLWEYINGFGYHTFWDVNTWSGGWRCLGMFEAADNTGPQDLPLWFLRNLIIIVLMTPVLHWLIKKWGKVFVLLLAFSYISGIWIDYMPLRVNGFFYFCLGSYLSINKMNISDCLGKRKNMYGVLTVIIAILCVYFDVTAQGRIAKTIMPMFVLCGVITAYNLMYWLVKTGRHKSQWPILAQSSFFVFAIHAIQINHYGMAFAHKAARIVFFFSPTLAEIVGYLIAPFIVGTACVMIYACMKNLTPKLLKALTGNR